MRRYLWGATGLLISLMLLPACRGPAPHPAAKAQPLPDLRRVPVYTPGGRRIYLNAAQTPLLFAAYWCPHCQADLPLIQERLDLMTQYRPVIVVFTLFRHPGWKRWLSRARAFVARERLAFPWVVEAPGGPTVLAVPDLVYEDPLHPGRLASILGLPNRRQLESAVGNAGVLP